MIRCLVLVVLLGALALVPFQGRQAELRIGSKKFTESVILGELLTQLARHEGVSAEHFQEIGGTRVVYEALRKGDIDLYPEYTGTIREEIFAGQLADSHDQMRRLLDEQAIKMSEPLGFNNTYALGMTRQRAESLGIWRISDLKRRPDLKLGFSNEFMDRKDGWPALQRAYGLPQTDVQGLDHDIAYRQIQQGEIDVTDVYTTDAKINALQMVVLEDDRRFFPEYDAVILYRREIERTHPRLVSALGRLKGQITAETMTLLNSRTDLQGVSESQTAAEFLWQQFGIQPEVNEKTPLTRIAQHTLEHLDLVRKSLLPAIIVAVPLGILAAKRPRLGRGILGSVAIIQTIPALALLVLLIAPVSALGLSTVGRGSATAVAALFLYSLLPMVRNTHAAFNSISPQHRESALALGLSDIYRLWRVELPLASPTILAGIQTAAVINVGFATLGALIGAGGYGQPIMTGIRLNNTGLIMQGALPAAAMALAVQGLFELAERLVIPRGLRLKTEV